MPEWLNYDNIARVFTSARKTTKNTAITDVTIKTADGDPYTDGFPVKLSGSSLDLRGLAANKPAANAVAIGATYWSVDTDPKGDAIELSNGTAWVVL